MFMSASRTDFSIGQPSAFTQRMVNNVAAEAGIVSYFDTDHDI